jgi:hypothetical protein
MATPVVAVGAGVTPVAGFDALGVHAEAITRVPQAINRMDEFVT